MNILIAPNSMKGSLNAFDFADIGCLLIVGGLAVRKARLSAQRDALRTVPRPPRGGDAIAMGWPRHQQPS